MFTIQFKNLELSSNTRRRKDLTVFSVESLARQLQNQSDSNEIWYTNRLSSEEGHRKVLSRNIAVRLDSDKHILCRRSRGKKLLVNESLFLQMSSNAYYGVGQKFQYKELSRCLLTNFIYLIVLCRSLFMFFFIGK